MSGSGFVLYTHLRMMESTLRRLSVGILALAVLAACQISDAQSSPITGIPPTATPITIPTASAAQAAIRPSIPSRIHFEEETLQTIGISPDATLIAVGTRRGVFVYDAETFRPLWSAATTSPVNTVDFSPTGQVLIAGTNEGDVLFWETATAARLDVMHINGGSIMSLDWSPDGNLLAVGIGHFVQIWNIARKTMRSQLDSHTELVRIVAFSPDGELLASGSDDRVAHIWDANAGIVVATIDHRFPVTALTWRVFGGDNDDWLLTTGMSSGTISLWHIRPDGRVEAPLYDWRGHRFEITDLSYAADLDRLLSAGRDGRITIWDIVEGERMIAYQAHETWAMGAVWTEDDTKVISAGWDGEVIRWDVED